MSTVKIFLLLVENWDVSHYCFPVSINLRKELSFNLQIIKAKLDILG